jgi:hypothetical protein
MVFSHFEKSAAYWIHIYRRALEQVRSAYLPNTSTFYIFCCRVSKIFVASTSLRLYSGLASENRILRTEFFKPVVVVSTSSPDCDGLRRTESEDRDRFDGGWLMLSKASGKLETH